MRLAVVFLISVLQLPHFLKAQDAEQCGTVAYRMDLLQRFPSLESIEKQVERNAQDFINQNNFPELVVTIPVVVHVLYNNTDQNLPDSVIASQIEVLNEDYNRLNADTVQTPLIWKGIAANCRIQFCLAQLTPDNQPTNGINRKFTNVPEWSNAYRMKFDTSDGADAWNPVKYLNVWVGNLAGSVLGISTLPGAPLAEDGIAVDYTAFGRTGNVLHPQYNRGRTLTHEIGHWLGLYHIWGDDGNSCTGTDSIADTPNQANSTFGCPAYPRTDNCTGSYPGIMFMNFMDYTNDACMNLFTNGQSQKMQAVLNTYRQPLLFSPSCNVGIAAYQSGNPFMIYPNPVSGFFNIGYDAGVHRSMIIRLFDLYGRLVFEHTYPVNNTGELHVDLPGLPPSVYIIFAESSGVKQAFRIVVRQ